MQSCFDALLRHAAQQLIDRGAVSDVRVLQNGRVVTGIAGDQQRVYVQYRGAGALNFEGECSCGDRSPCMHVAAVVMTAAKIWSAPATGNRRTAWDRSTNQDVPRPPEYDLQRSTPLRQSMCYLIEPVDAGGFRLSAWIVQTLAGSACVPPQRCAFARGILDGGKHYPRYVDARDREILDTVMAQQVDGPWDLTGPAGFDVLQRTIATGRAFWRSLQGSALRGAGARGVLFAWQALTNGDQRLTCENLEPLEFLLELEPAVYIDPASGNCGPLELPYPADLLRQYWNRPAIGPAEVSALNAKLACESRAERFPRLREMTIQVRSRSSLRPRLVLSAAPAAALQFLYDGMVVDSESPSSDNPVVRRLEGGVIHQVTRDSGFERQLQAQLHRFLVATPPTDEAWLAFMMHGVPSLRSLGWEIAVDAEFPYRIAAADDWYADLQMIPSAGAQTARGVQHSREWFDLRLGVVVDGHSVNLLPALVQYLQGTPGREPAGQRASLSLPNSEHLMVRLEDGRYLPVPLARIQRIADALVELFDQDGLNENQALRLPRTQASRLAQLALAPNAPALQSDDPTLLNLIDAVAGSSSIEPVAPPAHFPATLRPYQQEGLGWLQFLCRNGLGGILADDMGLGKTVQTLAHLATEKQRGRLNKPSLIVAPVSVLGNWQQEIRRFAPELRLLTLHGSKRKGSFVLIDTADVILIGYPQLLLDSEIWLEREFCFVILDEAQAIKNPQAKVSQVARALRAAHRLCLTGTPMENHLGELWSLCDFVQPGLLGEQREFQRQYRTPIENAGDATRAEALRRRIQPFLLRRTKDEVARDLPAKIEIVESIELDEKQRDFYDGIRLGQHRRVREAIEQQGLARSRITVLDALLKLRQACCDPRLIDAGGQAQVIPSAKLDWLSTTLPGLIEEGRRILLFSQFTAMLRKVEMLVQDLSIPYFLLTGETQQRSELVRRFQAGCVPLFLISLKAGGTGLNLTAADTIIHYDPWWNPAVEAQATDRAHRIGQDKPVFVYKLIARRTVEEKIMQLQADKHALVSQLYADASVPPSQPSSAGSAELEALFAP
jgi:superfamily II DNA or RNA helicase